MDYFSILFHKKFDYAVPLDGKYYEALFSASSGGDWSETTITGTTPIYFKSNGDPLTDCIISGNAAQSGTPTPEAPVDVHGVGEKTAQLIPELFQGGVKTSDGSFSDSLNRVRTSYIPVESGKTYAVSSGNLYLATGCYYNNGVFSSKIVEIVGVTTSATFTVPENVNQIAIGFRTADGTTDITPSDLQSYMLNKGSTALPYEPYGYKLDISSGGRNLFDRESVSYPTGTTIKYFPIKVPNGTYTLSTNFPDFDTKDIFFLAGNVRDGASSSGNGVSLSTTRTRTTENGYVTVAMRYNEIRANPADYDIMLNRGSTPLPYEPYNRITTPIYLGEAQTTRQIKKFVLDGTENVEARTSSATGYTVMRFNVTGYLRDTNYTPISTHYLGQRAITEIGAFTENNRFAFLVLDSGSNYMYIYDNRYTTAADFKSYLAQQYANGNPVTVWYVLAAPETAVVNEPLMKIGNYADTVSMAQSGVSIPTTAGTNQLTVDTTVLPSEVSVTGNIKEVST